MMRQTRRKPENRDLPSTLLQDREEILPCRGRLELIPSTLSMVPLDSPAGTAVPLLWAAHTEQLCWRAAGSQVPWAKC